MIFEPRFPGIEALDCIVEPTGVPGGRWQRLLNGEENLSLATKTEIITQDGAADKSDSNSCNYRHRWLVPTADFLQIVSTPIIAIAQKA